MSKYYAVANGRKVGIFRSWDETKALVNGYKGAKYKSFKTQQEAENYLNQGDVQISSITASSITTSSISARPITTLPQVQIQPQVHIQPQMTSKQNLVVYTDGSCINKIGGFGYVVIKNNIVYPICGRVPIDPCTNQIAELYAIKEAIDNYGDSDDGILTIFTDSKYSIGCLTTWCYNWQRNGWVNSKGQPVANKELIQAILRVSSGKIIKYNHVKAHNGDYYNEWADKLANEGRVKV